MVYCPISTVKSQKLPCLKCESGQNNDFIKEKKIITLNVFIEKFIAELFPKKEMYLINQDDSKNVNEIDFINSSINSLRFMNYIFYTDCNNFKYNNK